MPDGPAKRRGIWPAVVWLAGWMLAAAPVAAGPAPVISDGGLFRVSLASAEPAVPLGRLHQWHLGLSTAAGQPVPGARLTIAAAMADESHKHAGPTAPQIGAAAGAGRYLVDGLLFDRQGKWRLTLNIASGQHRDTARFDVMVGATVWADWADGWSAAELAVLGSLWIGSLAPPPADPSNAVADNAEAAELGHRLFFDNRLSQDESVACATCHAPARAFTDGRKLSLGIHKMTRNAPTIIGAAYSPWQFSDGRKDSLWAQAMAPFEEAAEHGTTRDRVVAVVRGDEDYRKRYQALFGPLPAAADAAGVSKAFANLGKAIAAYERHLTPAPSRFDRYAEAVLAGREPAPANQLAIEEILGLKAFIGENQGQCIRCHNGPMFSDHQFHNIGSQLQSAPAPELGRWQGLAAVLADAGNCLGVHSDAPAGACAGIRFAKPRGPDILGAFKTPTLRFLPRTAPYMHAGQIDTLSDVIWHYRDRPNPTVGESELQPLTMTDADFDNIEAFLRTLDGPIRAPARYLEAPR